jgi:predicted nucleic acid-binding Zn ribbon protein
MPTYEFRCPDGTIIERIFRISEAPSEIPSPNGDGMAVRIISGGAALLFKGSGFYITDYGKDGKKDQRTAGGTDKGSSGSTEGGSAGSDSKSASTGDTKSLSKSDASSGSKVAESKPAPSAPASPKSD